MGDHEKTPQTKDDEFSMKTKLILTRFGTLTFDQKNFLIKFLGFTPYWD